MIVKCPNCPKWFEDVYRTTICPHETFPANMGDNKFIHNTESYLSDDEPTADQIRSSYLMQNA